MLFEIKNFAPGLDTRKSLLTSLPGTLATLQDMHVNQGGELEKRKAYVATAASFANTFGAQPTPNGIMVFGSQPAGNFTLPAGYVYQQLIHPDAATAMTSVVSSTLYGDYPLVVAQFADGYSFVFYNGLLVADYTSGVVLPMLNTNAKIAAALAALVNNSNQYTAIQSVALTNEVDVYSQPGNSFNAVVQVASAANIAVTSSQDTGYTQATVANVNGLNAVNATWAVVGGKEYTFQTALTNVDGNVKIGATIVATLTNLFNAINLTGTPGTDYATAMTVNANVYAQLLLTNSENPSFTVLAKVSNLSNVVANSVPALTYQQEAATIAKVNALQSIGSIQINAFNPSSFASAKITYDGTAPANNDTVTINGVVYTFKNAPANMTHVKIQTVASGTHTAADVTMISLINLINGVLLFSDDGTYYISSHAVTPPYPVPNAFANAGALVGTGAGAYFILTANTAGNAANSFTLTRSSAHITITSGFAGGVDAYLSSLKVGPLFATGSFTTNYAQPTNHDAVVIGGVTYQFCTTLAGGATYDVLIGTNVFVTLQNLINAINGSDTTGTTCIVSGPNTQVIALASLNNGVLQVNALVAGAAANGLALVASVGTTLTASGATLTGGADTMELLPATVNSFVGQSLGNFLQAIVTAIKARSSLSGFTAYVANNTIYIQPTQPNSLSNDAVITTTVFGQICVGLCGFEVVNDTNAPGDSTQGSITAIRVNGASITTYTHQLNGSGSPSNAGSGTANTKDVSISNLNISIAADINTNAGTYCAVADDNILYIAKLVTSSRDNPINGNVDIASSAVFKTTFTIAQVGANNLVAIVTPSFAKLSQAGKPQEYTNTFFTCQPTGGYPPYNFLWHSVSGDKGYIATKPDGPTTSFSRKPSDVIALGQWACDVTDSLGNTVTSNSVEIAQPRAI
jgi:hypothetical protein